MLLCLFPKGNSALREIQFHVVKVVKVKTTEWLKAVTSGDVQFTLRNVLIGDVNFFDWDNWFVYKKTKFSHKFHFLIYTPSI